MDRRVQLDDMRVELEQQTFNLYPERWERVYLGGQVNSDGEEEELVTSIDEMDAFIAQMEQMDDPRWMSGAEVNRYVNNGDWI